MKAEPTKEEMVMTMAKHAPNHDEAVNRWDLPFGDFAELDFHADAFSIVVEPVERGGVPRIETSNKSRKAPDVRVTKEGNVVRVHVGFQRGIPFLDWIPWSAGSTLTIRVPANIHGRIHTGAGTLRARDLEECDLELITDAGTVDVERIYGNLRLVTSAGTIDGRDLAGAVNALTHAGTIDLSIAALDPGLHRIHTAAGTVRVDLARDMDVRVEANSNFGGSRVKFPSSPTSPAVLQVSSDAGTVRVRGSNVRAPARARNFHGDVGPHAGPYRDRSTDGPIVLGSEFVANDGATNGELDRVLQMVAEGTLSPEDASEVLRALGHG